jgi:hypothetical protein
MTFGMFDSHAFPLQTNIGYTWTFCFHLNHPKPTSADPNSHTAAGTGAVEMVAVKVLAEIGILLSGLYGLNSCPVVPEINPNIP